MAAHFLNSVRVLLKEGCEDKFIAAAEEWVTTEGMLDSYWAKTADCLFALLEFGRARRSLFQSGLRWLSIWIPFVTALKNFLQSWVELTLSQDLLLPIRANQIHPFEWVALQVGDWTTFFCVKADNSSSLNLRFSESIPNRSSNPVNTNHQMLRKSCVQPVTGWRLYAHFAQTSAWSIKNRPLRSGGDVSWGLTY